MRVTVFNSKIVFLVKLLDYSCFNDGLESKSGDEIPAKPETIIKSDERLRLQYVPVSDFSFKHIYVVLVAVITVIGVILTFLLLVSQFELEVTDFDDLKPIFFYLETEI